ncbi:hypothetical protein JCM11491_001470 [Sporobolomyces phaffii]
MPSLFRKLLTPKSSSRELNRPAKCGAVSPLRSGTPTNLHMVTLSRAPPVRTTTIKRWTSRNANGTSCSLPPELVLRILEQAWTDDLRFAATCALLCQSVLERVRRYLYACPTLHSVGQINLFLRAIKKSPNLARRVTRAVLNGASAGAHSHGAGGRTRGAVTTRLPQLLELCTNLHELTLKDAIVFSLTDFSHADALLHLTLDGTLLSDRTTTQRYQKFYTPLKNLVTLTLRSSEFDLSTADHFLSPRTLPSVAALELEGCRLVDNPTSLNDLGLYEPRRLAASLELVVLKVAKGSNSTPESLATVAELLPQCIQLRALSIEAAYLSPTVLEFLPLAVTHLSVLSTSSSFFDLFRADLDASRALSMTLVSLAAAATSSAPSTPFGSQSPPFARSPLSSSFSTTPLALSPFGGSPSESPPFAQTPQRPTAPAHALARLVHLALPAGWEPGTAVSEQTATVERIARECRARQVRVEYAPGVRGNRQLVEGGGHELRDELELVRKAATTRGAGLEEEEDEYLW